MRNLTNQISATLKKRSAWQEFLVEVRKNWVLMLMVLPMMLYTFIFSYIPMGGIIIAFKKYTYSGVFASEWIGFENFELFVESGKMLSLTRNTLIYNIVFIIVGVVTRIAFAIMITEMWTKYYKRTLQSIMMLPHFLSWVVIGGLAYNMLNYEYGTINNILDTMFGMERINVYTNTSIWPGIFTFLSVWHGTGYGMVFYLSAIIGINPELYEAAYLDGAGLMQRIFKITIPLIMPTTIIMLLLSLGGILKGNMDMFYQVIRDNSFLYDATDVIDTYVFRSLTTAGSDLGVTAATGLYQQIIGCVLVLTVNGIVRHVDNDSALF